MIKTSHIQKMRHILRDMRRPPEEGTNDATKNYKKVTPGQDKEIEEHCGVCDEQGIEEKKGDHAEYQRKRKEIAKKFGVDACAQLKDEDKKKACFAALDAAHVSDDEEKEKKEEVELDEKGTAYPATVDTLRKIVKDKQHQTVMFKSGKALVDLFTASAMVQVYDALKKPDMKKTFEKMITDKAGFMKTQAFAMKMIGK